MTNKEIYNNEINTNEEYNITVAEFTEWLEENNLTEHFTTEVNNITTEDDIYYIAVDYSIPVIMVKYFQKRA